MTLVFDHVLLLSHAAGREADAVARVGLVEATPNDHPGQGTACRRFAFDGCYLEIAWLRDRAEASTIPAAMLQLPARFDGGCPIGIGLRAQLGDAPPFETRPYAPSYLPSGTSLAIATASDDPMQPLVFALPFPSRSRGRALSRVIVRGPWADPTLLGALERVPVLEVAAGDTWSVELVVGPGASAVDIPGLPLRIAIGMSH